MEAIRHWAFGTCAAAIACGMVQLILPKSGMQRVLNVTVSVFFLSCLLSPVFFSLPQVDGAVGQEQMRQEVAQRSERLSAAAKAAGEQLAAGSLRREAQRTLESLGVEGGKIYVMIHDADADGISISECEVQLPREYAPRHDEIRGALMQRLGVNVLLGYDVKNEE